MPKGANGYRKMHRLESAPITILSDGNEDMGIHVVISGTAVPDLLEHFKASITGGTPFGGDAVGLSDFDNSIMIEFLQQVRRFGWLTRFDLAVDDLGAQYFTLDDVKGFLDRQEVVSKFRVYKDVLESTFANEKTGHTIYFGSRQSEVMLRVYDKQLEQNRKAPDGKKLPDPWVRWEIELKNDRANIAADFLIQRKQLGEIIMEILNNYVRVIVPDDSNRSRCSSHPLWEKFVGMVGKLRLYVEAAQKTIEDKKRWLIRQCLPTIAGVIIADGGSFDIITRHFDDAVSRMSADMRHLVTIRNPEWLADYDAAYA
ncbi:MAG: replication initiation factor domain-containing protein [Bacteroidales bacterium]|nr:replication initiation factor domain-containing protein [Bacteroidales bacterium]MCM1414623.1 replication initiation factor domain-containing protein [bacterium]MCM1423888.1 replication initiation factor domain-containing protein [bacterium]